MTQVVVDVLTSFPADRALSAPFGMLADHAAPDRPERRASPAASLEYARRRAQRGAGITTGWMWAMPLMVTGSVQPTRRMATGSVWVKYSTWANGSGAAYETGWVTGQGWKQTPWGLAWRKECRTARAVLRT
jgi:hypothetical protein